MLCLIFNNPRQEPKLRRLCVLGGIVAILLILAVVPEFGISRILVINTSPSVAPGLYVRSSEQPGVGKLIDFCIPLPARAYIYQRSGNSGANWYILKPIAAGPGDRIDATGAWLVINGRQVGPMPPRTDSMGRVLPAWRKRCVLGAGEFFVFSSRISNSFDSRCYGPIQRDQIASVRHPLITW
jgi:conjugative transfer signal peptidase TraF